MFKRKYKIKSETIFEKNDLEIIKYCHEIIKYDQKVIKAEIFFYDKQKNKNQ